MQVSTSDTPGQEGGAPTFQEATFLSEAVKRFHASEDYYRSIRDKAQKDIKMLTEDGQWDADIVAERVKERRPVLTFPRLPQFVDQVVGDYRRNRPQIRIRCPAGADLKINDNQTGKKYALNEIMGGLVRNIEYASQAKIAYDSAFESSVSSSMGHFRIITEYSDDDGFDQDIKIKRIIDPFSVHWDPLAMEYSREDAMWCFVEGKMDKEEFKARYPDAVIATDSISSDTKSLYATWITDREVRVCEYFVKVPAQREIAQMTDGRVIDLKEEGKVLDELAAMGIVPVRTRRVDTHRIDWYLITAMNVLEGPIPWPGRYIPIVSVWGKELFVDGQITYRSLIRNSHDAQRMYNYSRTADIEIVALQPKAPYLITAQQVGKYKHMWENANTENYGALIYEYVKGAPMPKREMPPQPSAGHQSQSMMAGEDLKATIGMYDASLGNRSNEKSGKAILARAAEGDTVSFPFIDNMARSIEYGARILVDLVPKIFDGERIARIRQEDDQEFEVTLNQTIVDQQTDEKVIVNDLSLGKYELSVDIGPSYTTRKLETADSMMQFLQAVGPDKISMVLDLVAKAQDWPGAQDMAKRFQRAMPQNLLIDPEDGQPVPPDPNLLIQQEIQASVERVKQMETEVARAKADADIATAEAKKLEAQARISGNEMVKQEEIRQMVTQMFQNLVAEAANGGPQ